MTTTWVRWLCFLPAIILVAGLIMPTGKNAGASVASRPPGFVFGLAWLAIVVALGVIWYYYVSAEDADLKPWFYTFFGIFLGVCLFWQFAYGVLSNKRLAVWTMYLLLAIGFILFAVIFQWDPRYSFLFAPILAWIIFAALLGTLEYEKMCAPKPVLVPVPTTCARC